EPLLTRPFADGVPDRVPDVGREPALLHLEHLVPTPGLVEPERRPGFELRERVLELVAIVEDVLGRKDRLERRLLDSADAAERVADLLLLRGHLSLVGEILETAAAAGRGVRAGRVDPLRSRLEGVGGGRPRVPTPPLP